MTSRIIIAGSTGGLGKRVVEALGKTHATVIALVRESAKPETINELKALGAMVRVVDLTDVKEIASACAGADCVVSCVAGLRDVIVDTQTILLEGAIKAGVRKFIPSDFSTDFTKLPAGENRNFDLRREFHETLDLAAIDSAAIFNGAFAEILGYNVPILDFKRRIVGYWGDPAHLMDFTTMDDAAAYTAAAAVDPMTPRALRIASFQVSANDLVGFTTDVLKSPFSLVCMGSLEELQAQNKKARAHDPEGENQLYSQWQQGQYMQSMFSTHHESLDNDRYQGLDWTRLEQVVSMPRP